MGWIIGDGFNILLNIPLKVNNIYSVHIIHHMLSQEDHFVLSKVIGGIQEQVDEWPDRGEIRGPKEEVLGFLQGLRDVVNELGGLEK